LRGGVPKAIAPSACANEAAWGSFETHHMASASSLEARVLENVRVRARTTTDQYTDEVLFS